MDEKLPPWLKRDKDSVLYNGDGEFFFYVPEKFFDIKLAFYRGEYINILGIMDYAMKDSKGKMGPLHSFKYPTRFLTAPYKVDKMKNVKLIKESEPSDYRILCYKKGDPLIVDVSVPNDLTNVEDCVKLLIISGNIPNTIPYDKIQDYILDNIRVNGANYGICLQMFGIIVSELCRDKDDISIPFRLSKDKDMHNYKPIGVKQIAKLTSAYSALTSENFNEAIVHASLNKQKVQMPLERILTGEDVQ